jgi:hypothetical protein
MHGQPVHARLGVGGGQTIEVVIDHGYHPQAIVARAGVPLRVVFRRRDTDDCTDRVVFSSPHIDRRLARGSATTIFLPAQPPGEVRFTCGMGRYHGQIQLRADRSSAVTSFLIASRHGIDRALAFARRSGKRNVAEIGSAMLRVQLARGEIDQGEFDRARAPARRSGRGEATLSPGQSHESTRGERRAAILDQRRSERRRRTSSDYQAQQRRDKRLRTTGFGLVVVVVLGTGVYLAAGDLFGQRESASTAEAIPVRLSMAGFTPGEARIPAGETIALELWTTDAAPHLQDGVHTMISDELGIYEELPAAGATGESRRVVEITAPAEPGTYDIYCDTCCGGKDSPTMHAKLIVEAQA